MSESRWWKDHCKTPGADTQADPGPDSSAPADDQPPPFAEHYPQPYGDYELLGRISQGGMGVVFRARQISLPRVVALKVIRPDHLATPEARNRFRAEAESVARLDHPNIVPIYEVGEHDKRAYFTMRLVEGGSLCGRMSEFALSGPSDAPLRNRRRNVAAMLASVARAVHHAHERGILHRDLKPSNVLLDADGNPHVTDFGLARPLGEIARAGAVPEAPVASEEMTLTGAILGTPRYLAPEQAAGDAGLTAAVDVYALGVILYELLTGRPPFQAETLAELLPQIRDRAPTPPRQINPAIDAELEAICLRCLEKDRARRFGSAAELADALDPPIATHRAGDLAQALFREAGDALFLFDPDTDALCDANPMAEQLTGLTRLQLLGVRATELFRSDAADEESGKSMRSAVSRTSIFHAQSGYVMRTGKEGVWLPVNLTISRLHLSRQTWALCQVRDMSAEQEGERRLRGLEQQLRRVLWSVSDCLWRATLSPEGAWAYQSFSPAVERLTGRPARRFVGERSNWLSLVHPDDRADYAEAIRRMINGQGGPVEYRMLLPDGGERWLRESVKATPQADRTTLLDGVVSDATAVKQLERARRRIEELEAEIARLTGGQAGDRAGP